jgi:hypothetical protein
VFGIFDAYLAEAHVRLTQSDALYSRVERVTKSILGGGFHPPGFVHQHAHSIIGAVTAGYMRDLIASPYGRFGVGADITAYGVPANLQPSYGQPLSFHIFLRYRPAIERPAHIHH